jgi:uncharacterized membrane protein YozB (DUF420 family)
MFLSVLAGLIFLHAGTPVVVSQMTLTIMFVVLGIVLIGIGFGHVSKTKESLMQHRWTLTAASILTVGAISLVMIPAAFRFYIDPDLQFFEALSISTVVHAAIGFSAVVTALIYVFGDLPVNVKKWMRITALLWITTLALGVVVFLQMLSLI